MFRNLLNISLITGLFLTSLPTTYATTTAYANPHALFTANGVTYMYDNNGNLTVATTTGKTLAYTWDYKNNLMQAIDVLPENGALFLYDYNNDRVKLLGLVADNPATTTYYATQYFDQSIDATGTTTRVYIYSGDTLLSTVETKGTTTTRYYNHPDHLGSTAVSSKVNGYIQEVTDYYPYGNLRLDNTSSSFKEPHKYIGKYLDTDTDLQYLEARYYDPRVGRFTSQDPVFLAVGNNQKPKKSTKSNLDNYLSDSQEINSAQAGDRLNSEFASSWNRSTQSRDNSTFWGEYLRDPQQQNSYNYARNNPIKMKDSTGELGVFANIGFSVEAGLLSGLAGTASAGRGFVAGGSIANPQAETGNYGSYGSLVGGFFLGTTIEGSKGTDVNSTIIGANVGPSGSIMFTNATKLEQLDGITRNSWSATLGLGTFQWSKSKNGIWTFSAGLGTLGLSLSSYPTNTKIKPDKKNNKKK